VALSVKIQGLPRDDARPIWSLDHVNWWRASELVADPRFRSIQEGGYQDHVAILSRREAQELCDRYRERGARLDPGEVTLLDAKLRLEAPESCWVVVIVYEWESGL
jgi:hypothetical protein